MSGVGPFSKTPVVGYDLARYSEPLYYSFGNIPSAGTFTTNASQIFTLTANTEIQQSLSFLAGPQNFQAHDLPITIMDTSSLTQLFPGDDTAWDSIHEAYFPIDTMIDRIQFNFAMGLNVSARTAGNWNANGLTITVDVVRGNTTKTFYGPQFIRPFQAFTNLAAVGNQMLIVNNLIDGPIRVPGKGTLRVTISFDPTVGTGTEQIGLITVFPWANIGGAREYTVSGMLLYSRPDISPQTSTFQPTYYADIEGEGRNR